MFQDKRSKGLVLLLVLGATFLLGSVLFAANESITLVTYYPSPFGSYNHLQTNRFVIGDANNDGDLTDADQANRDGDLRLTPQSGTPSGWPVGPEGQIAYSQVDDTIYYSNGSSWVASGGGRLQYTLSA